MVSQCFVCTQLSVHNGVCQRCGYKPRPVHPLHPNDAEEPDASPSDSNPPDPQLPPGHGPVPDEWGDWVDLGAGG